MAEPRKIIQEPPDKEAALERREALVARKEAELGVPRVLEPYYPRRPQPAGSPSSPGGTQVTLGELDQEVIDAINSGGAPHPVTVDAVDPIATNDVNAGFAVGDHWINSTTSSVWQAIDVSAGAAVWIDLTAGGVPSPLAWRVFDIAGPGPGPAGPAANDPMNIITGTFDVGGAQTLITSALTPVLPATGTAFAEDSRIKVFRNGQLQDKGANAAANRDVYFVSQSPPKIAFEVALTIGDTIIIEAPST